MKIEGSFSSVKPMGIHNKMAASQRIVPYNERWYLVKLLTKKLDPSVFAK